MQAKAPECVSMALCDEVWTDSRTGRKSVLGIFEDSWAPNLPDVLPRFVIFAEFLGFEGTLPLTVKLCRRHADRTFEEVSSTVVPVYSSGLEALARLELEVRELFVPEAGEYRIALELFGSRVAARRLLVRDSEES